MTLPLIISEEELRAILRRSIERWGGQKRFCAIHGCAESHLSSFLSGRRLPGPTVLDALNLEAVTYYQRKRRK